VAQDWQVAPQVRLRVVWPLITGDQFARRRAAELEPPVPQLVLVGKGTYHPKNGPDFSIHRCQDGRLAGPDPREQPTWRDLAAALGGTGAFFPSGASSIRARFRLPARPRRPREQRGDDGVSVHWSVNRST
jgi:hypothetical protein